MTHQHGPLFTGTIAGWTTGTFDHNGDWETTPLRIEIQPDQDQIPSMWPTPVSVFTPDQIADHDRQQHDQAMEAVRPALDVFAQLTEAWAHLRMDTDQDQRLHDRLVTLSRQAIRAARHVDTAEKDQ